MLTNNKNQNFKNSRNSKNTKEFNFSKNKKPWTSKKDYKKNETSAKPGETTQEILPKFPKEIQSTFKTKTDSSKESTLEEKPKVITIVEKKRKAISTLKEKLKGLDRVQRQFLPRVKGAARNLLTEKIQSSFEITNREKRKLEQELERELELAKFRALKHKVISPVTYLTFVKPKKDNGVKVKTDFKYLDLIKQFKGYKPRKKNLSISEKKKIDFVKSVKSCIKLLKSMRRVHSDIRLKSKDSFLRTVSTFDVNPIKYLTSPGLWRNKITKAKDAFLSFLKRKKNLYQTTDDIDSFPIPMEPNRTGFSECRELLRDRILANLPYHFVFIFRISNNNIFCHLTDSLGETVFPIRSSSYYDHKVSNVNLRHFIENVLSAYSTSVQEFLKEREILSPKQVVFKILAARKYRRKLLTCIRLFYLNKMVTYAYHLTDKRILLSQGYASPDEKPKNTYITTPSYWFDIPNEKPFNGCRVRKLKRKKRFRVRKFKLYR